MKGISLILTLILCAVASMAQVPARIDSIPLDNRRENLAVDSVATDVQSIPTPAQPKTTPVDVDDDKPPVVLHYYDKHGEPLDEPVRFLAVLDTVQTPKSKPIYEAYNGINLGLNFGDAIFMAFGQKYGSFDLWANVSIHNWFFPTLELGLGFADSTPKNGNFTYKTKPSFYAKLGINYNFLYKSNPDYQVYLGLRAGVSGFTYDLKDVTVSSDYWGETQRFDMNGLKSTCIFGEALAGLQVKIVKNFSLGWNVRWHFRMYEKADGDSKPWFVPGYGGTGPFGFSVSAIWTIGRKPARELPEESEK